MGERRGFVPARGIVHLHRPLLPYLGTLSGPGYSEREYPWIYANPIYVRP